MNKEKLIAEIKGANTAYAVGKPFMTDTEYDKLWRKLHDIDPKNPLLYHTARDPRLAYDQRPHKAQVFGTQKAFSMADLKPFLTRFADSTLIMQPKYDGCAVVLYKQPSNQFMLLLEGDGCSGRDITHLLPQMRLTFNPEEVTSCEAIIPLHNWHPSFGKNPRNTVAGWIARPTFPQDNVVELVSHNGGALWDTLQPPHNMDKILEQLMNHHLTWSKIYPIDGIMLKVHDEKTRLIVGHNDQTYLWSIAWKPPIQTKATTLIGIEWNISRSGRCIPTLLYKPIDLCGTTNTRVTGNNAQWVKEHNFYWNQTITIGKAGEIIPKLIKVEALTGDQKILLPTKCPDCGNPLIWKGVDLICEGTYCLPQLVKQVAYFYSDKGMDLKSIGEKRIYELMSQNPSIRKALVNSPWMLLDLPFGWDILLKESWGEKRFKTFLTNREEINSKRSAIDFIASLGYPGLARKSATKIYHAMKGAKVKTNISKKAVDSFLSALGDYETALEDLKNFSFCEPPKPPTVTYCITGQLSAPRSEMIQYLADHGWEFSNQVSKFTDYLLIGELKRPTTKSQKAKTLGITVITEEQLPELIKEPIKED